MFISSHYDISEKQPSYHLEALMLEQVDNQIFVTGFDFDDDGKPMNRRVVDPDDVITKLTSQVKMANGIIDSRILVNNPTKFVFHYTPDEKQIMFYKYGKNILAKPIRWCSFVFKYEQGKLSIAAYRGKKRPTLTTRLYYAPLPNVHPTGSICLGSCTIPKNGNPDDIAKAYFESCKTHLLGSPLRGYEWRSRILDDKTYFKWLLTKVDTPIKMGELNPIGTLADFI